MARNEAYATVTDLHLPPKPRDAILDHFDQDIRAALDRADYREVARLAGCAAQYERTLWRGGYAR